MGSSQTRARTRVPCIGRRMLNHCTTREVPLVNFWVGSGVPSISFRLVTLVSGWNGPLNLDLTFLFFRFCHADVYPCRRSTSLLMLPTSTVLLILHDLFRTGIVFMASSWEKLCCTQLVVGLDDVPFHPRSMWSWPAFSECTVLSVVTGSCWRFWRPWLWVVKKSVLFPLMSAQWGWEIR